MPEITINSDRIERIVAQILRDEAKLLPDTANRIAGIVATRLYSSMNLPTNQPLQGYRIIPEQPPRDSDIPPDLWRRVYSCGKNLPGTMADQR